MKKNFDIRLAALREYLKSLSADETTFVVEGGGEYHTKEDPFNYLMQHGAFTHDGKCIVLYPHPVEGLEPLSAASWNCQRWRVTRSEVKPLNNSIKARLASLQAIVAQKQTGVAIMLLLENGAWAACRAPQSPAKVFQTEQAARDYLSDCESVIIIDL